jgi:anti-sigma regulatory factor (Ser/Thr protein kinase)
MIPRRTLAFSVSGGIDACRDARRAIAGGDGAVPASVRENVLLLVTELVANAVRHAGVGPDRSLHVELERWPRRVRVEVVNPGAGFEHTPLPSAATGGWGLLLVDRIAESWGIASRPGATCVWFELGIGP